MDANSISAVHTRLGVPIATGFGTGFGTAPQGPAATPAAGADAFAHALGATRGIHAQAQAQGRGGDAGRKAAEDLVSIAFVQPILAQLRNTNQAAGPFAPGRAEQQFGPLYDAEIARRIVRGGRFGLVDAVASRLQDQRTQTDNAQELRA